MSETQTRTGRPPIGPEVKARITDAEKVALEARAAEMGIDRSEAIHRAVQHWLAETPTSEMRHWLIPISGSGALDRIEGRTLRQAVETNFKRLMGAGGYRLVRVTAQMGRGRIGGRTYAELTIIYNQLQRLDQYSDTEDAKTIHIYAEAADLPQAITFDLNET